MLTNAKTVLKYLTPLIMHMINNISYPEKILK
jgi:hypothetical protein